MKTPRKEAWDLVDALPDEADWDDIFHIVCVGAKTREGQKGDEMGRLLDHEEVQKEILLMKNRKASR